MLFGIVSVFLKQLKIILLLGYFSELCKFISIFFVLRNQFCILTFVAFSEHSVLFLIDVSNPLVIHGFACSCFSLRGSFLKGACLFIVL